MAGKKDGTHSSEPENRRKRSAPRWNPTGSYGTDDADRNEYWRESWLTTLDWEAKEKNDNYFLETFPLSDYPCEEVWLCPECTNEWTADAPVTIVIQ